MKRSRGRGRRQQNPVNRSYDSNGPDVRVRGTASQVFEKYQALARDATSSGDRVMAENYQQHAEHYFRILQSVQPPSSENYQAANGVSEDTKSSESNVVANTEGGEDNGAEPLLIVRESENGEKEASKSRRRGPLSTKRKAKSEDAAEAGETEAAPTNIDTDAGGDGETLHSGE